MALLVLDASVVIALLDERDVHHQAALEALEAAKTDEKVLPASAFAEVLVIPFRRGEASATEFQRTLSEVPVRIAPITAEIARSAAALRGRHTAVRLADALVLATGAVLEGTVLTADRSWRRFRSGVQVI